MGIEGPEEKLAQPVAESGSFRHCGQRISRDRCVIYPTEEAPSTKGPEGHTAGRSVTAAFPGTACKCLSSRNGLREGDNGHINHRGRSTGHMEGPCSVSGSGNHEVLERSVHSVPFP